MAKLKIAEVEKGLVFEWPEEAEEAQEIFYDGLDYLDEGKVGKARVLFKKALEKFPEHIDILHHLSITSEDEKEARELNEKAVQIGLSFISKFDKDSLLEWGWTENRPFLRAYYQKGLIAFEDKKIEESIKIFNQIIFWNPNDNQGAREMLADIYLNNNLWEEMVLLDKKYSKDYNPEMNFGIALALFKLGRKEEAMEKLKRAIKNFPKCAKILLETNPKEPKQVMPGYIAVGGDDQAYSFWEIFGCLWQEKEAGEWLKEVLEEK